MKYQYFLNGKFSFESYVEDDSNKVALSAARKVANILDGVNNPLFICGEEGLGKTHLMQAIGNALLQQKPDIKVVYLPAERFVANVEFAFKMRKINELRNYLYSINTLLIDDIQFLIGKEIFQIDFLEIINTLLETGCQIVIAGDDIFQINDKFEEQLISRARSGLAVSVTYPTKETRIAILKNKAERDNIVLTNEVAAFLVMHVHSNIRALEGALTQIDAYSRHMGCLIDLDLARNVLVDRGDRQS